MLVALPEHMTPGTATPQRQAEILEGMRYSSESMSDMSSVVGLDLYCRAVRLGVAIANLDSVVAR
jgi:hypothetical protein